MAFEWVRQAWVSEWNTWTDLAKEYERNGQIESAQEMRNQRWRRLPHGPGPTVRYLRYVEPKG